MPSTSGSAASPKRKTPFGGLLGSTFNFVFETQLEKLQDGDRFYYLERTAGLSFDARRAGEQLVRQADHGQHRGDASAGPCASRTPGFTLEVDQTKQFSGLGADTGNADPTGGVRSHG